MTPQVVTPNGFENDFVPKGAKWTAARRESRRKLLALASSLCGRTVEPDALLVATSGRNEYRNKGIDLYIDAMELVRREHPEREAVAFIFVPAWSAAPVSGLKDRMEGRIGTEPELSFSSHRLHNEDNDSIFCRLMQLGGNNNARENVSFIYVPCYLDGKDGILDMTYYEMMPGLDLTVFPSYYEPWGYTPLESISFGVPTVSTDKAGFGQWIMDNFDGTFADCGAEVVERTDSNYEAAKYEIAQKVRYVDCCDSIQMSDMREAGRRTAEQASWQIFIGKYLDAYREAMKRRDARLKG